MATLLLGYWSREVLPIFAFVFLAMFWICLAGATVSRIGWVLYNIAFAFLTLAAAEVYFGAGETSDRTAYPHLMQTQDSLGYTARSGVFRAVKTYGFGARVVYDVHYSLPDGRRNAPDSQQFSGPPVMFFGDSLTFGDGVNDKDTLPNAFSILAKNEVINFGLSGYGAHHMLRLLELGIPKAAVSNSPRLLIYTALEDHIRRAAGHLALDNNGPLYELRSGNISYAGSFQQNGMACVGRPALHRILARSYIWRAYANASTDCPEPDDETSLTRDRTRFLEIVKAADRIARETYSARLIVLLWNAYPTNDAARQNLDWIKAGLAANSIPVLAISTADSKSEFERWSIKRDGHPNAEAYVQVARELLFWLEKNGFFEPSASASTPNVHTR